MRRKRVQRILIGVLAVLLIGATVAGVVISRQGQLFGVAFVECHTENCSLSADCHHARSSIDVVWGEIEGHMYVDGNEVASVPRTDIGRSRRTFEMNANLDPTQPHNVRVVWKYWDTNGNRKGGCERSTSTEACVSPAGCNEACNEAGCAEGLECYDGVCRNPQCPEQSNCECPPPPTNTPVPPTATPAPPTATSEPPTATPVPPTPTEEWGKSSLSFTGACQGDCELIQAQLCNSGDGDMTGAVGWAVYYSPSGNPKNGTVVASGSVGPLSQGQCTNLSHTPAASGNYMFWAEQEEGHPGTGELWSDSCSLVCEEVPTETPPPPPPPTETPPPPTATIVVEETPELPTETPEPPTATPEPPEETPETPTETPPPPTATIVVEETPEVPTETPEPPEETPPPPTATIVVEETPEVPTETPEPPEETPPPPTATIVVEETPEVPEETPETPEETPETPEETPDPTATPAEVGEVPPESGEPVLPESGSEGTLPLMSLTLIGTGLTLSLAGLYLSRRKRREEPVISSEKDL